MEHEQQPVVRGDCGARAETFLTPKNLWPYTMIETRMSVFQ